MNPALSAPKPTQPKVSAPVASKPTVSASQPLKGKPKSALDIALEKMEQEQKQSAKK
jgi:hypothetical protein